MASESALHESVRELLVVAASESAVAAFADHGGLEVLVEVLAHENADVVAAAVEVMEEIVDPEMLARKEQLRNAVVTVFLDQQGLEVLVESAERLDRDNVDEMSALDKILVRFDLISLVIHEDSGLTRRVRAFWRTCWTYSRPSRMRAPRGQIFCRFCCQILKVLREKRGRVKRMQWDSIK